MKYNSSHIVSINIKDILVKKDAVLRLLGYENIEIEAHLEEIIDEYINKALALLEPRAGFIIKKIIELDRKDGRILLDELNLDVGKIIAAQLKHVESVALFQCTIGDKVELFSEELFARGDSLEGYIVNLSGSEAAESMAENIHREIKKLAEEDQLKITNRFSPGYCNWNVKEQFKLFSLFPDDFCGISLTDSALMKPIKSVSGLVGIGADAKFRGYNCSKCDDEHCIYRNKTSD